MLEFSGFGVSFKLAETLAQDPTFVAPSTPQVTKDQVEVLPEGKPRIGPDGLTDEVRAELMGFGGPEPR